MLLPMFMASVTFLAASFPAHPDSYLDISGGSHDGRFSPESTLLAYVQDGHIHVQRLDADASPKEIAEGASPRWQPLSNELSYLHDGRLWVNRIPVTPEGDHVSGYAWSPSGEDVALLVSGQSSRLQILRVSSGDIARELQLAKWEDVSGLNWSPDGRFLTWHAHLNPAAKANYTMGIRTNGRLEARLLDLSGDSVYSEPIRVLPVGTMQTRSIAWRPDGRSLSMLAAATPYGFQSVMRLAQWSAATQAGWDVPTGFARYLTDDEFRVESHIWSPDGGAIYFTARRTGSATHLYAMSLEDSGLRRLSAGFAHRTITDISPDGHRLACTVSYPDRLTQVLVVSADVGEEAPPLAVISQPPSAPLASARDFRWRSVDGLEIEGVLLFPPGSDPDSPPGEPLPTVIQLHGGPVHASPITHLSGSATGAGLLHYLAASGYLVLSADYRRSGHCGWDEVRKTIERGDYVGLDAADVLASIDALIAEGLTDPARVGLFGHSHGGFLANWLLTRSSRFAAVVSAEGATDHRSRLLPDSILEVWMGGKIEEVPGRYRRYSPIIYADTAVTPTLLVYGEKGVYLQSQGIPFRDALEAAGCPVELLVLPGEGHAIGRRENQETFMRSARNWFAQHMPVDE